MQHTVVVQGLLFILLNRSIYAVGCQSSLLETCNMRSSCDPGTDVVEITPEEDWWGVELFPTTSSPSSSTCSDHGSFQVLAKSSSSKPGAAHSSTLFSCFGHIPVHMTEASFNVEPRTPLRSEVTSSSRHASGDVMEVDSAVENSHRGYTSAYESDLLHVYSDEEPTSPVMNCIGQVRPKKKPKHMQAKRSHEPAGAVRNGNERASPRRSSGKWKQMLQLAPTPQLTL